MCGRPLQAIHEFPKAQTLDADFKFQNSGRLGLREMERNSLVAKGFLARDFFVSFLISQKRKEFTNNYDRLR